MSQSTAPARSASPRSAPRPAGPVVPPKPAPEPAGGGTYDPGTPPVGGGRVHPAAQDEGALTPAGHRAYCAKNIRDAVKGAEATAQHSGKVRSGLKKNKKLTWAHRQMAIRRNKRADRKVIAAQKSLAKAWLNKAKVREQVDMEINTSTKQRPSAAEYTTE